MLDSFEQFEKSERMRMARESGRHGMLRRARRTDGQTASQPDNRQTDKQENRHSHKQPHMRADNLNQTSTQTRLVVHERGKPKQYAECVRLVHALRQQCRMLAPSTSAARASKGDATHTLQTRCKLSRRHQRKQTHRAARIPRARRRVQQRAKRARIVSPKRGHVLIPRFAAGP